MEKIAEKLAIAIQKNNTSISKEQYETIKFGLECLLNETVKTLVYMAIFSIFSLTGHFLVAFVFFSLMRSFAGGYHEESFTRCFIVTFLILTAAIVAGSQLYIPLEVRISLMAVSVISAAVFAPVDHPNKPILSMKRRRRFKYLSIVIFIVLSGVTFLLEEKLATTAAIVMLSEAISLPVGQIAKRRTSL